MNIKYTVLFTLASSISIASFASSPLLNPFLFKIDVKKCAKAASKRSAQNAQLMSELEQARENYMSPIAASPSSSSTDLSIISISPEGKIVLTKLPVATTRTPLVLDQEGKVNGDRVSFHSPEAKVLFEKYLANSPKNDEIKKHNALKYLEYQNRIASKQKQALLLEKERDAKRQRTYVEVTTVLGDEEEWED